jgi:hypothetical protein
LKTTFLHRDIEEEIYMKQPKGFCIEGKEGASLYFEEVPVWIKTITKNVVSKV